MELGGSGGGGSDGRTGARILSLLATPGIGEILNGLSRGPHRFSELRREIGSQPQAKLRAQLRLLEEIAVVVRRRRGPFPSAREYELTNPPGRELLFVATTLETWLAKAPEKPLPYDGEAGRAAIEALVASWSSTMLRALAGDPGTLADLEHRVGSGNSGSLERRLEAMRRTGLVESEPGLNGDATFVVTDWLRQGVAPIAAAARWERRHISAGTTPIRPIDVEAAFLLAMPLLRLPPELSGSCRLAVEFGNGNERCLAGVTVDVGQARAESCTTRLDGSPAAWATGPPAAWLRTTIEADTNRLELGGDQRLVRGLLDGLNRALFGPVRPRL